MAFVSRAERKFEISSPQSALGPGWYNSETVKQSTNFAPFRSSTERELNKPVSTCTPGPGSYLELNLRSPSRLTGGLGTAFGSQQSRFTTPHEERPGPGSYNVLRNWTEKKITQKVSNSSDWLRMPSAPSIPGPKQGYGYDETVEGELLIHKGPDVINGTQENSVGPGHYDHQVKRKLRGVVWYKTDQNRHNFLKAPEIPGPGSYALVEPKPQYKLKATAAFASRCKRGTDIEYENAHADVPGPGRYLLKSSFTPSPSKKLKNFGGSGDRFKTESVNSLGPGYYDIPESSFISKSPGHNAPFSSTNSRFKNTTSLSPGPGAYRCATEQRRVWGKFGIFGSSEKRFYSLRDSERPGPGSYSVECKVGASSSVKRHGLSVFVSKSQRMNEKMPNAGVPPPGKYEIKGTIGVYKSTPVPLHPVLVREDQPVKSVGFNAQAERFFADKTGERPGPGSYYVDSRTNGKKIVVGSEQRFKETRMKSPGPGSYIDRPEWNKRTFNVLFE